MGCEESDVHKTLKEPKLMRDVTSYNLGMQRIKVVVYHGIMVHHMGALPTTPQFTGSQD